MINYTTIPTTQLRDLCVELKWFTCGDFQQYEKLFYANENGCPIEEIAAIIWLCSDDNWCRRDILSVLISERKKYLEILHN